MQTVPILYGMTVGEYAQMLVGEQWIKNAKALQYKVIPCLAYDQLAVRMKYILPVPPSPNLKNSNAIRLYPGLCFFEGTVVSVGRGTDKPFEQWGHPDYQGKLNHTFTPKSTVGATKPLLENQICYGIKLDNAPENLDISQLLKAYQLSPQKDAFFNSFFEKLAGTRVLRQQIIKGKSEAEIRASWQPELEQFKKIRKKYLLYQD
jgi:uncharacterized protein YbbC (DUF1343 family)